MAIQVQGQDGTVIGVDGTTFRAQRTTPRPLEYGAFGHYRASVITGAMAAGLGADSEIAQFRWTDATRLAVIYGIKLDGVFATTAFAVGQIRFYAKVARAFSAAGTGGNTTTLSGDNQNARTTMGASLLGELRSASTAALGAGTKTLDANPFGQINSHSSAGPGAATPIIGSVFLPFYDLYKPDIASGEHPIVLAANEGFTVHATVPGTGVWTAGLTVAWAEAASF